MAEPHKIKIIFAIGRFSVGGGEKLLVHQFKSLNKDVFDPYLVTLFPETADSLMPEIILDDSRRLHLRFRSLFDLSSWLKIIVFMRRERFDAVVTSLFSANLIVRIVAILVGAPVIVAYEHNIYPDKGRWQIFMDRLLAKKTAKIIVDAESAKEFTVKQEAIPADKFITMHIPPLAESAPKRNAETVRESLGLKDGYAVVLTVSRLVPEKGHRYLIRAAAQVLKIFPRTYFLIVGWGPLEKELKGQIKASGFEDRVLLTGRRDIAEMLPIADIYVEPVLNVDIGIALMEAMRAEKPIVATSVGEMSRFIKDGDNGFLVQPAQSDALAEKIIALLSDETLARRFASRAKRTVEDFSMENYMREFERLILGLVRA